MDETSTSEKYIIQSQKPLCNAKADTIQHMKDDDTDEITKSLCQLKDVSASGNTSVYHKDRKPIKRIISNELMRRNNFIPTDTNQENTTELSKEVFSTDTDCGKQIITFSNERTDRERVDKTELSDINLGTPHKTVFHCSECKYVTGKMPNLVKHSRMKHNAKIPHSCKVCNYKCNFKSVLQKHMRTHTGYKPYNCKHCDYKCADKSNFGRHLKYHNRGTDFQCSLCPLKFPRKYDLITHVRSHGNSQKPYACKHCDYKCSTASDLIFHARIHTGEKFYSCEDCDYKCLKSSDLKIHVTNHTTGNPYSCKLCDFKCSVPSALITHSMSHTDKKPYTCKQCNFRCSNSNALLTHAWSHTSEKPFCCKHCEYKCSRSSELINHARTHNADKLCDNDFNADLT
ncbi:jg25814 [Pararge aegeria aegeria]|uniref:Jg25814 protein n=1 Tax=Pararge aegeria aegeria TaxID=348720 RepID=A0A8S4QK31_9NEOP|nr:jg25814 [Pararge aegeria aegeria]